MEKFAERLKELRQELNLSTRWELAKSDITLEYLIRLSKLFKVSLDYLAGLED